jgi:hypothetical protein
MVIISPPIFDLLFYVVIFLFGLDFSISGFLVLRENSANFKKPRLIGLWIIRRMSALYSSTNSSKLFAFIYSTRNMAIQALFSGVLLIIGSLIMIVDIGVRLF